MSTRANESFAGEVGGDEVAMHRDEHVKVLLGLVGDVRVLERGAFAATGLGGLQQDAWPAQASAAGPPTP